MPYYNGYRVQYPIKAVAGQCPTTEGIDQYGEPMPTDATLANLERQCEDYCAGRISAPPSLEEVCRAAVSSSRGTPPSVTVNHLPRRVIRF